MMISLLALTLAAAASPVLSASPGTFADGGNTLVSGMMMFLGNEEKMYILDKAEGNAAQINGHPAWGAVWDINTHQATAMAVTTNVFCASGMHLPNGSYVTFGGNGAVGPGGNIGSVPNNQGSASFDATYQDYDGGQSIRILNPCTSQDNFNDPKCQWFDNPAVLSMIKRRWYSTAEALADGSMVLIGGFVNGGYINRNTPDKDPAAGGAAENTYEFFPANGRPATPMQFMLTTSGLNSYAHAFLMSSGKMFVQANISTILWDYDNNIETPLPNMPGNVARVYPASGAVAMLPLTPANNYLPTIIFCGGSDMPDDDWGNYSYPAINTWNYPASNDCQRITPEPADGSQPTYVQDDDMLEGRTMGQFIILPDGKLLIVNGGLNGTAGYATATGQTSSLGLMPYGESLAAGPVGTPAIYDPNAPAGKRWSRAGFSTSNIARLYHSSAMLLPDGSVMIAGSNPNVDVNLTTVFPTTYKAEIFYPSYFSATTRPVPTGVPSTVSYGGNPFDVTLPSSSYSGAANDAAANTTVVLLRGGFTTHAMNMGQRYMQLNNTFTVNKDGSITLHVAQAPPNPNIFQPGPALFFVVVNGIPSNGTMIILGSGQMQTQPTAPASVLPASVLLNSVSGTGGSGTSGSSNGSGGGAANGASSNTGAIIGGAIGAVAVIGILGALFGICITRRRRAAQRGAPSVGPSYAMSSTGVAGAAGGGARGLRSSDSSAFVPLQQDNHSTAWNASTADLNSPYRDEDTVGRASGTGMSMDFDPYSSQPRATQAGGHRY
jgi:hypothetical protein